MDNSGFVWLCLDYPGDDVLTWSWASSDICSPASNPLGWLDYRAELLSPTQPYREQTCSPTCRSTKNIDYQLKAKNGNMAFAMSALSASFAGKTLSTRASTRSSRIVRVQPRAEKGLGEQIEEKTKVWGPAWL